MSKDSHARDRKALFEHFLNLLSGEDDKFAYELTPQEICAVFMDAHWSVAHQTGHECEREVEAQAQARRSARSKARKKAKPVTKESFFREMGVEPPRSLDEPRSRDE